MKKIRLYALLMAVACALTVGGVALAAEVDCDSTYCFGTQDFSVNADDLKGVCITGLPAEGTVYLGQRVIRTGDILTADQLEQMTFQPLRTEQDVEAQVTYLPIFEDRVEKSAVMTISIRGKADKAPEAQDSTLETYKNLPNEGKLKATDPEGEKLTYTLQRAPKRGQVELRPDGTFCYTPKKNKVGVDSFTYTAADPAGNVSRTATVTIQILKPTEARQYTDTMGTDCRFEAEWMKNTGLFVGEKVAGMDCFFPEKAVSRGEFLTMLTKVLELEPAGQTEANVPTWLQPYAAAAKRAGLTANVEAETWNWAEAISPEDAAVMAQNALALKSVSGEETAIQVMAQNGAILPGEGVMTRGDAAKFLYQVTSLSVNAPGMQAMP